MTPTAVAVMVLAGIAVVTALCLGSTWVIEPGDPASPDPARRKLRFRPDSLYRWAADNGPLGIALVVALFGAFYLGLCLVAVVIIRAIPGLVP